MKKSHFCSFVQWVVLGSVGFIFLSPSAVRGQEPMQGQTPVPMMGSEFRFVPGTWGMYKLTGTGDMPESKMVFSVLDEVKQRKGKAYWMEIEIYTNDQPAVVTRILVPDTGDGPGEAIEACVQITGYRPFKVPRKYLKADSKNEQEQVGQFLRYDPAGTPKAKNIEWKGRTLKASTVDVTDAQGNPSTVTISMDAPPLCIVMLDSSEVKMELLDWGTGATTKITGQPVGLWRWIGGVIMDAFKESDSGSADQND